MTIQQITTAINKEWNSNSMIQLTIDVEGILDLRLNQHNPTFNDILNNTNHILSQIISQREKNINPIICCVYAAVGVRVISLYVRNNHENGMPNMGSSLESLPWNDSINKLNVLTAFVKSMRDDFNIEILSNQ